MAHPRSSCLLAAGLVLAAAASDSAAAFVGPWDPLIDDSWIVFDVGAPKPVMHTVNGGDRLFLRVASRPRGLHHLRV
ncbi:MAG: hypothetical protein FJ288_13190 [Planctomycetes bacterium]|nr:hypothetical protein [Planctomycetota bacterium]